MPKTPKWQEMESEVTRRGLWPALLVGILFLLMGVIWYLSIGGVGIPFSILKVCGALFVLFGCAVSALALGGIVSPARVRHAAAGVLPVVPNEPVIREGLVVHGRLTHKLWEDADGWQFRPASHHWRNDKGFVFGFGIPFLAVFSGLLTWVLHSQLNVAGWFVSAVCGTFVTVGCGGIPFLLIGLTMRGGYRRLARLTVPRNEDDLELDLPEEPTSSTDGLKWLFLGETKRQRLSVSRKSVVAVQLCPWKYVAALDIVCAVQGLLVLATSEEAVYNRLPILLTADAVVPPES